MTNTKSLLLAVAAAAMAFTFSCTSDGSGGGPIKKPKITGVSQKGPFVEGSTVTLYELNEEFIQTGRSFRDIIADNKGTFEIRGVELISPYAMLEASGFYRNEVSGYVSRAPITLFAIADIREKDNVNVNLLTHLEYYRVLGLVENGKTVADAKKQAQKEILAVFGISGEFKNSEDMSIFGTTEGDAALLAISILLQGDLSEGPFSQRLTNFAQSLKTSGTWEDEAAKAAMADWAFEANLAGIKSNILAWGLSSEVPDFGKYVTDYWTTTYGLGACNSSNAGEIKNSNKDVRYICKNNNWAVATEFEKDVYQWVCSASNEGEIKAGNITDTEYICKYGLWKIPNYKDRYCLINDCQYFTDSRDKQRYAYVVIGEQTWMAENLNYNATSSECYSNLDSNCDIYGRFYDWSTAMALPSSCNSSSCSGQIQSKHRGICPSGWHLPTSEEWRALSNYVQRNSDCNGCDAILLKATSGWNNSDNDYSTGTDDYGFSALPGGDNSRRGFDNAGVHGMWWSASEDVSRDAYRLYMGYEFGGGDWRKEDKSYLFSVRCLQD